MTFLCIFSQILQDVCPDLVHIVYLIKPEKFWEKRKTNVGSSKYTFEVSGYTLQFSQNRIPHRCFGIWFDWVQFFTSDLNVRIKKQYTSYKYMQFSGPAIHLHLLNACIFALRKKLYWSRLPGLTEGLVCIVNSVGGHLLQ